MKLQVYGKTNTFRRIRIEVKERFKPNKYAVAVWRSKGCEVYVPKLNKTRFGASVIVSGVLCSPLVPLGFVAAPLVINWGLK